MNILEDSRGGIAVSFQASECGRLHSTHDAVACGAPRRPRSSGVRDLIAEIYRARRNATANISALEEAAEEMSARDSFVTTLAGYTLHSTEIEDPGSGFMCELSSARMPFLSGGRIWKLVKAAGHRMRRNVRRYRFPYHILT